MCCTKHTKNVILNFRNGTSSIQLPKNYMLSSYIISMRYLKSKVLYCVFCGLHNSFHFLSFLPLLISFQLLLCCVLHSVMYSFIILTYGYCGKYINLRLQNALIYDCEGFIYCFFEYSFALSRLLLSFLFYCFKFFFENGR